MYTVMTIDDERSIRDGFKLALEDFQELDVLEAENGLIGVELFKKHQPDLIFLDLKMPVMNGAEALKQIRALNPNVPVYIVTAFAKEFFEELQTLQNQGLEFEIAAKPISLLQIKQITQAALNLHGGKA
ncbi:MAG: response regulator [Thiotrichales bacterium]|nr:response regulator [Thiotrichales bacterium]